MYLTPLDPSSSSVTPEPRMMLQRCQNGFKLRKLNDDVGQQVSNITQTQENDCVFESEASLVPNRTEPTTEEESQRTSAKSDLYKLCGVRHWKAPVYDCCDNDGPCHMKLFTVKATVEIKEDSRVTVLECFGDPQQKKKIAAEQAAEAALWYLKNSGQTIQTDKASGRVRSLPAKNNTVNMSK